MKIRPFLIVAGLSLVFIASLLLVAKPLSHLSVVLPPVTVSGNVPYYLYLRVVQKLFHFHSSAVMIANAGLMWMTSLAVFRVGWLLADAPYRLEGGTAAMVLFTLNPLTLVLPLTMGFLGGSLMVPFLLLLFIGTVLAVENWSAFMRAIALAVVWSFFLWVHLPTAVVVLVAMIPWVLYNRRPLPALGIFLTTLILGTVLFSTLWTVGCAVARRWSLLQDPVDTLKSLSGYVVQGLTAVGSNPEIFQERFAHVMAWLSPFLLFLGLWSSGKGLRHMSRERRTTPADLTALISLVVLAVVLFTEGKHLLPGAWYLVLLVVCWCPLIARNLAKKENFYSRGFRWTTLAGFVVCGIAFCVLHLATFRGQLVPDAATLLNLVGAVMLAGGIFHTLLKKHPLTLSNRLRAFLTGATLAYFLVMDYVLLR